MEQQLREQAIEEHWKIDWAELHKIRQQGEADLADSKITEAFRNYTRTLSLLADGMRITRDKQEVFKPNFLQEDK